MKTILRARIRERRRSLGFTRAELARSERDASDTARMLADRLTHDPFLGEAAHKMVTQIAAVRSAAEILVEYDDIEPERRERFLELVHEESHTLTEVGAALASYFDRAETTEKVLTPLDENVSGVFRLLLAN